MENIFITFIILADSLDDPALLRSVASLRHQDEFLWSLEVRTPEIPDEALKLQFTHDNPRISVICNEGNEHQTAGSSDVFAILPRGVELFPSACSELKKAFSENNVDIVLANIISLANVNRDSIPNLSQPQTFITTIHRKDFSNDLILIREISLPLGKFNVDALAPMPLWNTKTPDHMRDKTIRTQYIFDLEEENLILTEQMRFLASRPDALKSAEANLRIARARLSDAEAELQSIRNSRTWRVGRLVLMPVRAMLRIPRYFQHR